MQINIPDNIKVLQKSGSGFVLAPEAEEALVQLNDAKKSVEEALDAIKKAIETEIITNDPTLRSLKGDKVTVSIQDYGAKYGMKPEDENKVHPTLFEKKVEYKMNTDEIEKFAKKFGHIPDHVIVLDRGKTTKLIFKK